jgi:hypothetical protein
LLHYQSMATRESNYVLVYQTHPVEDIPQVWSTWVAEEIFSAIFLLSHDYSKQTLVQSASSETILFGNAIVRPLFTKKLWY